MKTFDEVYETLPGDGWLTRGEAELLWLCCERSDGPILEVGCYRGRSTVLLASFGRQVVCVDPFAGFDSIDPDGGTTVKVFLANMSERGLTNVLLVPQRIEYYDSTQRFGLAYLDGDHTYEGTESQVEFALAAQADVIAVHDVNDSGGGVEVKKAALELLGPWDERVERLAVWYRRDDVWR